MDEELKELKEQKEKLMLNIEIKTLEEKIKELNGERVEEVRALLPLEVLDIKRKELRLQAEVQDMEISLKSAELRKAVDVKNEGRNLLASFNEVYPNNSLVFELADKKDGKYFVKLSATPNANYPTRFYVVFAESSDLSNAQNYAINKLLQIIFK